MRKVIPINKSIGLTPKQAIERLREMKPELEDEKLSYAGRLDPMAEGVLLILVGDENKQRENYLRLDKEYEFEVVLGLQTDTYDGLGLANLDSINVTETDFSDKIAKILPRFIGKLEQSYPPYSSKPVYGKPLWWWAREGRINEIDLPKHGVVIHDIQLLNVEKVSFRDMINMIIQRVDSVDGLFRQDIIVKRWYELKDMNNNDGIFVYSFHTVCTSGMYVRQLVSDIGELLGIGAFTYSIKRTRVGNYSINDALRLENN